MSSRPRARTDRLMRAYLCGVGLTGAVTVSATALTSGLGMAVSVAPGWFLALLTAWCGYRLGWISASGQRHVAGQFMLYPVDADGVPTAPMVTGQLVVDDPRV